MSFVDKQLTCRDCSNTFLFTGGEQEFYASKGLQNEPVRCPPCRSARKSNRLTEPEDGYVKYGVFASFGGRTPRQMHPATCADCGMMTEVPFQPRGDRPVYCSACYNKIKGAQEAAEAAAEASGAAGTTGTDAAEEAPAEPEASPELAAAEAAFPSVSGETTEDEKEKIDAVAEATDSPADEQPEEAAEDEEEKVEAVAEATDSPADEQPAEDATEAEEEKVEAVAEATDSPADEQASTEDAEEATEDEEEKAEAVAETAT